MSEPRPVLWIRGLISVLLMTLMVAGPIHNQVLGHPYSRMFKPWRMYFGFGIELCEVVYVQISPAGDQRTLDRYALLEAQPWYRAPEELRTLPDGPTIGRVGQRLCAALPGPRPDVRARARCASIRGWEPAMALEHNFCRMRPSQIQSLEPTARRR